MNYYFPQIIGLLAVVLFACTTKNHVNENDFNKLPSKENKWIIALDELSDKEYPFNPDISIRHSKATYPSYKHLEINRNTDSTFSFTFVPKNNKDTIKLSEINLMEWIPTVCEQVKQDEYLTEIAIINQEWNRHQVKFVEGDFKIKSKNTSNIKRVDLARNCLNAYLWEFIAYAEEDSVLKPYYHAWFNFPKNLYAELFEHRNGLKYEKFSHELENWIDPQSKVVDFSVLRNIKSETKVKFENLNHQSYPLVGERKKKHSNIIFPKNTTKIDDFLTDSTQFATFSPPGFYNPKDPRKTKLSLLKYPLEIIYRDLTNETFELDVRFLNTDSTITTKLIVSGLRKEDIPIISVTDVNQGWMNSMGFGNHTFYESYEHCIKHSSIQSNYFAVLVDENNKWLDSHFIGIDGPLLHWDYKDTNTLHLWILAFERHAFVGHYTIEIPQ